MKKIFSLGLFFILFCTTTFAYDSCNTSFTKKETTQLQNLAHFLDTKTELIENKFPGTTELTKGFAKLLYNSLDQNCEQGTITNYRIFQKTFSEYISNLILGENKKTDFIFTKDKEAEQAILDLQQHIIKLITPNYDNGKTYSSSSITDLSLDLKIPDLDIDLTTDAHIETDGKYNLSESEFDITSVLDLFLEGKQTDLYNSNAGELSLGVETNLIKKDDIFIAVNNLNIDVNTDDLGPGEQLQVVMTQNMIDKILSEIKGKYINVSENVEKYATDLYTESLMNPQLFFNDLENTALFDFYKQNDIRYGKLNTKICKKLEKFGLDSTTCENEINSMSSETQGYGYLILKKVGTEYQLGLTDNFIDEKIPQNLDYSKIITRDTNKITDMYIPLDQEKPENNIIYNNDTLDINYTSSDVNLILHGTLSNKTKSFQINMIFDDDIVLDADVVYNNMGSTQTISMEAVITQNNQKIGSFRLANEEVINYLQSVSIQKPTNIISIKELENITSNLGL